MSDRPLLTKVVAVVAVLAGLGVLGIEVARAAAGTSTEVWVWGPIGLLAVVLGVWELVAGRKKAR